MADVVPFCSTTSAGLCRSAEDVTTLLTERRQESCLDDMEESEVIVGDESDDETSDVSHHTFSTRSCSEGVTAFNREFREPDSECYHVYLHMDPQLLPPSDPYVPPSHTGIQTRPNYTDYDSFRRYSLDNRLPHQLESLAEEDEIEYTQEDFSASESENERDDRTIDEPEKGSPSLSEVLEKDLKEECSHESEDLEKDSEWDRETKDLENSSDVSRESKDLENDSMSSQKSEQLEEIVTFGKGIGDMKEESLYNSTEPMAAEKIDQALELSTAGQCDHDRSTKSEDYELSSVASTDSQPKPCLKITKTATENDSIISNAKKLNSVEEERRLHPISNKTQSALRSSSVQSTSRNVTRRSAKNSRLDPQTSAGSSKFRTDVILIKEKHQSSSTTKDLHAQKRSSDSSVRSIKTKVKPSTSFSKYASLRQEFQTSSKNEALLKEIKKSVDTYGTLGRRNKLPSNQMSKKLSPKESLSACCSKSSTDRADSPSNAIKSRLKQSCNTGTSLKSPPVSCRSKQDQGSQANLEDPRCSSLLSHIDRLQKEAERSKLVISQRHHVQAELAETRRVLQAELSEKQLLQLQLERASEKINSLLDQLESSEADSKQLQQQYQLSEKQSQLENQQLEQQLQLAEDQLKTLTQEKADSCSSQCLLLRQVQESEAESRELLEFMQMEKNALADALKEAELKLFAQQNDQNTANENPPSETLAEKHTRVLSNGDISPEKTESVAEHVTDIQTGLLDGYIPRISFLVDRLHKLANQNACSASRDSDYQSASPASVEGRLSPDGAECQNTAGDFGNFAAFSTVRSKLEDIIHIFEQSQNERNDVDRCHSDQAEETESCLDVEICHSPVQQDETLEGRSARNDATSLEMINRVIEVMTESGETINSSAPLLQLLHQLKSFRSTPTTSRGPSSSEEER